MTKVTEVRLTLAAFIYCIEIDLKNVIKQYITPFQMDFGFLQDSALVGRTIERFKKENQGVNPLSNIDAYEKQEHTTQEIMLAFKIKSRGTFYRILASAGANISSFTKRK